MKRLLTLAGFLLATGAASAAGLDSITNADAVGGLKEALTKGAQAAVADLGKPDGFLGNPQVKIPLPPTLQKVEKGMRTFGMGKQADELIVAMNRAAEAAVPEAKALLVDAVKKMTVQDAKAILTGSNDAATQYFRTHTEAPLAQKFLPIVKKATAKVGLAQTYNNYAGQAAKYGLVDMKQADLDNYVTQKALDGLYKEIAVEEAAIRKDPVGQGGKYISKVFGALKY